MSKIIAVDFDGTLCEDKYPEIGMPNWYMVKNINKWKANGHKVILWTCRCDERLEAALNWCKEHDLEFDAVNDNLPEMIEKFGSNSRKIYADYYIDDKNLEVTLPVSMQPTYDAVTDTFCITYR